MYQTELSDSITVDELCELLSIGRNSAYSLLNSGDIKAFRIGRIWKISRESVFEYIKRKSKLEILNYIRKFAKDPINPLSSR